MGIGNRPCNKYAVPSAHGVSQPLVRTNPDASKESKGFKFGPRNHSGIQSGVKLLSPDLMDPVWGPIQSQSFDPGS